MDVLGIGRLAAAGLAALGLSHAAHAVPPGEVSLTAQATCEYRAIAAQHPDPRLRNRDQLATKFCGPLRLPKEYEAARDVMNDNPEAYAGFFYVNARTHHIDEQLEAAVREGVTQVVVLGAGFDSRAYRFHDAYPQLAFFEVDLPATLRAKQSAVLRVLGQLPQYVRYVPVDFDTLTLESALPAAGYDSVRKSLFILEGVTMYVNAAGVEATIDFIGRRSPSGSRVVFDYVLRQVVEGNYDGLYAASSEAKGLARIGEPFVTGWTPAVAHDFLRRHGMELIRDLDDGELTPRYLIGSNGKPDGRLPNWLRIIDARVR
jgi:methyltransferase (TIGR00027 family)